MNATRLTPDEIRTALRDGGVEIRLSEGTWRTEPQPIEGGDVVARRVGRDEERRVCDWHDLAAWLETLRWREHAQA